MVRILPGKGKAGMQSRLISCATERFVRDSTCEPFVLTRNMTSTYGKHYHLRQQPPQQSKVNTLPIRRSSSKSSVISSARFLIESRYRRLREVRVALITGCCAEEPYTRMLRDKRWFGGVVEQTVFLQRDISHRWQHAVVIYTPKSMHVYMIKLLQQM